ncbi:MAG TPA: hypothetical protein VHW03_05015, partial [Chthoniobacterales bacterium]|nr:hypothetical protein [Chthoniobacterales bacterium]
NLRFHFAENDAILFYSKMTPARDSIILVVVNLDPEHAQTAYVHVPFEDFGELSGDSYEVQDLLTDAQYVWHGRRNYIALHPTVQPAHIFRVRRF